MSQFTKGQRVAQVMPAPIAGTVAGFAVDQETGTLQVRVEWTDTDADGAEHAHARYFSASELQDATPAAEPAAAA